MLTSLTVSSDARLQPLVHAFGHEFADATGVPALERAGLVRALETAVRFVRNRAYPDDPTGRIEIRLEPAERGVRVTLHDWGRPLISAEGAAVTVRLGGAAEDVRLINLGADGKRLTFLWPTPHLSEGTPAAIEEPRVVPPELTVRDGTVEDAEPIAQLLYANYALSYVHPDFYRPRWLREELAAGRVRSTVALHGDELVGHHALLPAADAPVAETGVAVVAHAFRGLGIFGRLSDHTLERARELGLRAVYGRAVTMHPYSQRAELAHGYRETALCLGGSPGRVTMRGLGTAIAGRRTALMVSFLPLQRHRRRAALPARHRDRLLAAYAALGLDVPEPLTGPAADDPQVSIAREPEASCAVITVRGFDEAQFTAALDELLAEHVDVIYADLDLEATAEVDHAVDALRAHGFSYAGLWPNGPGDHDHLRLQRLNCTEVELDAIATASDAGADLVRYVLDDLVGRMPAGLTRSSGRA